MQQYSTTLSGNCAKGNHQKTAVENFTHHCYSQQGGYSMPYYRGKHMISTGQFAPVSGCDTHCCFQPGQYLSWRTSARTTTSERRRPATGALRGWNAGRAAARTRLELISIAVAMFTFDL